MTQLCKSAVAVLLLCAAASAADDAVPYPTPIRLGDLEVIPKLVGVAKVPLDTITGKSKSEDQHLIVAFLLKNHSQTKRVHFLGWPHKEAFLMNYTVTDEHDNVYKAVTFGLGSRVTGDEVGTAVEPGETRVAVVVAEKPIAAANTLILDLDGEAIGKSGSRLRWKISRADWEKKAEVSDDGSSKPTVRTWTTADGKNSIEAEYVGMTKYVVKLRRTEDGKEITVQRRLLSKADQDWLKELQADR